MLTGKDELARGGRGSAGVSVLIKHIDTGAGDRVAHPTKGFSPRLPHSCFNCFLGERKVGGWMKGRKE